MDFMKLDVMAKGDPGWVGAHVRIVELYGDAQTRIFANVRLVDGVVTCDRDELMDEWCREGVKGRASSPRLYPSDGQAFLDELPYAYRYT